MAGNPSPNSLFTCTFCHHISEGPPQVIGRSARLACSPCYHAVLDLSICWVCGEVVYREDECVSLGWCFWHRACYGCLLCGSKLICHGTRIEELFNEAGSLRDVDVLAARQAGSPGYSRGREVSTPPLCAVCFVDAEVYDLDDQTIIQKGLRRIDRSDGGLTRRRWEFKQGTTMGERLPSDLRESEVRRTKDAAMATERRQQSGPLRRSPSLRLSGDGSLTVSGSPTGSCSVPLDSTIYVSITDPIHAPAFKPSPTKPIPLWMQMTPERRTSADRCPMPASLLYQQLGRPRSPQPPSSGMSTACPTRAASPKPSAPSTGTEQATGSPQASSQLRPVSKPANQVKRSHKVSYVSNEPLKRPSSRLSTRSKYYSKSEESAYMTPPEYPFPEVKQVPTIRNSGTESKLPRASRAHEHEKQKQQLPHAPLDSQLQAPLRLTMRAPPPQSSEYLDRYKPVRSPSASAGSSRTDKITEKVRKASRAEAAKAKVVEETVQVDVPTLRRTPDVEAESGGISKRRYLQELRRLFGGAQ